MGFGADVPLICFLPETEPAKKNAMTPVRQYYLTKNHSIDIVLIQLFYASRERFTVIVTFSS